MCQTYPTHLDHHHRRTRPVPTNFPSLPALIPPSFFRPPLSIKDVSFSFNLLRHSRLPLSARQLPNYFFPICALHSCAHFLVIPIAPNSRAASRKPPTDASCRSQYPSQCRDRKAIPSSAHPFDCNTNVEIKQFSTILRLDLSVATLSTFRRLTPDSISAIVGLLSPSVTGSP